MTNLRQRSGRLSIIPGCAVDDMRLGRAALHVLMVLGTYGNEHGWCYPSLNTLAKRLGVSRTAVIRQLKLLEEYGYIEIHATYRRDGGRGTNRYRIIFDLQIPNEHRRLPLPTVEEDDVAANAEEGEDEAPVTPEVTPPATRPSAAGVTPEVTPPATHEVTGRVTSNVTTYGTLGVTTDVPLDVTTHETSYVTQTTQGNDPRERPKGTAGENGAADAPVPARPRQQRNSPAVRDLGWEALVAFCGYTPISQSERRGWNRALKELREQGASDAAIAEAGRRYAARWPEIERTPFALAKHYVRLMHGPAPAPRRRAGKTAEDYLREMAEMDAAGPDADWDVIDASGRVR